MNALTLIVLIATSRGIVTAHDHRIELAGAWSIEGVRHPTAIAASGDRVVVLDAINNEAVLVTNGSAQRIETAETPIAASFVGDDLYILARDAGILHQCTAGDPPAESPATRRLPSAGRLPAGRPAGCRRYQVKGDLLKGSYLYDRATGTLTKIDGKTITVPPFASDLEADGDTVYLTYPREGVVRSVRDGKIETIRVGAVPVDLAIAGNMLAVADPSSKRVWFTEGRQSVAEAFARGFIRGFLGLSGGRRDREFPTGVDRVETRGRIWVAYDSSSGTLYQVTRKSSTVLARGVPANGWALTANGVAWWDGTSVAQKSLR